ncbi:PilZ domain-containing protein [Halopseudomonas pachastrellae]|uniref:PilZ domain-containing protein n=1 Tax=Halopseudomonas pachastrellae TaxID=254161 RepID=UPI003D7D741E|tara:strand:- start:78 stop:638 length:561 start_codon:yes stop_codon:yes gene_type:complete
MHTDHEDSREFFRIQDQIHLECKPIAGPEVDLDSRQSGLFNLLTDMHMLDYESQHLLRQISERDRAVAQYLKIINKRIDLLGRALAMELSADFGAPQQVGLSEDGMDFISPQPYPANSWLALHIVLLPSPLGLALPARVTRCEASEVAGSFKIAVNFDVLNDAQRQLLARHILQKQAQDIRAAKST